MTHRRLVRWGRLAAWILLAGTLCGVAAARDHSPRKPLGDDIERLVAQARLGHKGWAVRVLELASGPAPPGQRRATRGVLYEYEPQRGLVPASNMKLATTAAALDLLGPAFQFETVLARRGNDLVIIGAGDPTTGDPVLAERDKVKPEQFLLDWAAALRRRGLTHVAGDLLVDDTIFDRREIHPNWPKEQLLRWYEAPVAGLNYNNNCLDVWAWPTKPGKPVGYRTRPPTAYVRIVNKCVTAGKKKITLSLTRMPGTNRIQLGGKCPVKMAGPQNVTVHDPSMLLATFAKEVFAQQGVSIAGGPRRHRVRDARGELPADVEVLAVHRTPFADVLWRANTRSLNMVAECLFKRLGAHAETGSGVGPAPGSWESGRHRVNRFLRRVGIPAHSCMVDDGSGMSRANIATVYAFTEILAYVFDRPYRKMFIDSLAVAGKSGTLKRRLASRHVRGKVFGKTGTLRDVMSLSGYVNPREDVWFCFSMILNDAGGERRARYRKLERDLCDLLATYRP